MTDTLRHRALGALAVLRHTSHHDKAAALSAYLEAVELQSEITLRRAARLHEQGWRVQRSMSSKPILRLRHARYFYKVNLHANGDAEFQLLRVWHHHRVCAHDDDGFDAYIKAIDQGEEQALRWAKWSLVGAVAILVTTMALWTGQAAR